MSLKRKDYQAPTQQQGLRVAAGEPHLVSLGGGRLSTAVTIHHLPIGEFIVYRPSSVFPVALNQGRLELLFEAVKRD